MLTVPIKTKAGSVNELISPREENKVDRDPKVNTDIIQHANLPIHFAKEENKT